MCSSLAVPASEIVRRAPVETEVAWVHRQAAPRAMQLVTNKLDGQSMPRWRLFHILGGSANLVEVENAMDFSLKCEYHQVQLGFVVEQSRTRWLTHSEIAGGVIEEMMRNQAVYTVGTTHPPGLRPST
ncbi:hypothetical protein ACE3MS_11420 [Paenibacillus dendritiformis]|uniref:hypothetical protein n=1 Tax=Paenibacillus dendritiformis TaxID=130049 RepID=UPI00365E4109